MAQLLHLFLTFGGLPSEEVVATTYFQAFIQPCSDLSVSLPASPTSATAQEAGGQRGIQLQMRSQIWCT